MGITATKRARLNKWFEETGGIGAKTMTERKFVVSKLRNTALNANDIKPGSKVIIVDRENFPRQYVTGGIIYYPGDEIQVTQRYESMIIFNEGEYDLYIPVNSVRLPGNIAVTKSPLQGERTTMKPAWTIYSIFNGHDFTRYYIFDHANRKYLTKDGKQVEYGSSELTNYFFDSRKEATDFLNRYLGKGSETVNKFYMLHAEGASTPLRYNTRDGAMEDARRILSIDKTAKKVYIMVATEMVELAEPPVKVTQL